MMLRHCSTTDAGSHPSFERPIDLVHLARQTLGDRGLEREILALFLAQAGAILARLGQSEDAAQRMDLAHTLKGSARAVGAWQVATAAETCECCARDAPHAWHEHLDRLRIATGEACRAIADVQRAA